ncbi:stathmin domain-containing protein 1 isoform 2-T2 [Liasis olivaceus]
MKRSQSIKEENKCQYIGAIKSVSKIETERQTSSDILEELRMQGIIKTSCPTSKNRTADDAMLVHTERILQKPPAKLEKLEIKQKKSHDLPIEDPENKVIFNIMCMALQEDIIKFNISFCRSPSEKGHFLSSEKLLTLPNLTFNCLVWTSQEAHLRVPSSSKIHRTWVSQQPSWWCPRIMECVILAGKFRWHSPLLHSVRWCKFSFFNDLLSPTDWCTGIPLDMYISVAFRIDDYVIFFCFFVVHHPEWLTNIINV